MSSPEFPFKLEITTRDALRAVGDFIGGLVRHLPSSGFPSSRGSYEAHPDIVVTPVKDPYSDSYAEVQVHGFRYDERIGR